MMRSPGTPPLYGYWAQVMRTSEKTSSRSLGEYGQEKAGAHMSSGLTASRPSDATHPRSWTLLYPNEGAVRDVIVEEIVRHLSVQPQHRVLGLALRIAGVR